MSGASCGTSCSGCSKAGLHGLRRLGEGAGQADFVVALAGNPNTGKSTVFNALTGLRQHTGNWPGKTVVRAEGSFVFEDQTFRLVDLPGTYSLLARSADEEVARDFLLFGRPDVTIVVADATRLERNLNLVLQVLEITDRVVVCLNLMDEAKRHGLRISHRQLAIDLGVPVVPAAARSGEGLGELVETVARVARGELECKPYRIPGVPGLESPLGEMEAAVRARFPDLPNARWVAMRLLDGDDRVIRAVREGEIESLAGERPPGLPEAAEKSGVAA